MKNIIEIANKFGVWNGNTVEFNDVGLIEFVNFVRADEREACAKVVEDMVLASNGGIRVSAAIRARGNT